MVETRSKCVGCPPEMGCMGSTCPHANIKVRVCDDCKSDAAYIINGEDFCESHASDYIRDVYNSLDIPQKAETIFGEPIHLTAYGVCEQCKEKETLYLIDDILLCMDCAEKYLRERFDQLTLCEKAEYLGLEIQEIGV